MITNLRFDPDKLQRSLSVTTDIVFSYVPNMYGSGMHPLKLHFILPRPRQDERLPVLLWICGGGWAVCEPMNAMGELAYFANRGYIVAMAEYRITNTAPFPAQIIDTKAAIRYVRAHADQLHADPDRIALMGGSAGGHLVSLAGLTPDDPGFSSQDWPNVSDRVQAVVSYFGVMDIEKMVERFAADFEDQPANNINMLMGGWADRKPELMRRASPLGYVTKDAPPFLLIHGTEDPVVPVEQSVWLYDSLQAAGVRSDLILVEGAGHSTQEFSQPELYKAAADFLDDVLCHQG